MAWVSTPAVTSAPAASWPRIVGMGQAYLPSTKCRSLWQTPQAPVRISTSRGPGLSTWTSSIVSGASTSRRIAAFMERLPSLMPINRLRRA